MGLGRSARMLHPIIVCVSTMGRCNPVTLVGDFKRQNAASHVMRDSRDSMRWEIPLGGPCTRKPYCPLLYPVRMLALQSAALAAG
jgi:hypothetical protein